MIRPLVCLLLPCLVVAAGCRYEAASSNAVKTSAQEDGTTAQSLDFDELLAAVDNAIGKRFQAMQMDAMNSASYQYDGSIETVVDIVDPIAKTAGFMPATIPSTLGMGEAEKEMQARMGITMSSVDQRTYAHPDGDILLIARVDISNNGTDMKMLTIQLMNPQRMSELGARVRKP